MKLNEKETVFNDGIEYIELLDVTGDDNYISAKVVCDSMSLDGHRLTTLELRMPRIILAEFNTHRMFSRNTASTRAVRFDRLIDRVLMNPYFPIYWGSNKAGMVAGNSLPYDAIESCKLEWGNALKNAIRSATELDSLNLHKQHKGRLLEPFLYVDTIVTATEWNNFFKLRLATDAQPEIRKLAIAMKAALDSSTPVTVDNDSWHLPYITVDEKNTSDANYLAFASAMRCARVSYLNHDSTNPDVHKDVIGGKNLSSDGHCFIDGTKVLSISGFIDFKDVTYETLIANVDKDTLEFVGWEKPITIIAKSIGDENIYYYPSIGLGVTENHTMIGSVVGTIDDRIRYTNSQYRPNDLNSKYCKFKTKGESRALLPKSCEFKITNEHDYLVGKFIGFYIGDGFKKGSDYCIRLVKDRKIAYLKDMLFKLKLDYTERECGFTSVGNVIHEFVFQYEDDLSIICGNNAVNKKIPSFAMYNLNVLAGVFDGLKNSDGSLTKNTWNYSTISSLLQHQMVSYSKLVGLSIVLNKPRYIEGVATYRLRCDTHKYHTVNSGKKDNLVVIKKLQPSELVYCVEVPNHALIIETQSGRCVISGNCSPLEHQGKPMNSNIGGFVDGQTHMDKNGDMWSGNFKGWSQFRHL